MVPLFYRNEGINEYATSLRSMWRRAHKIMQNSHSTASIYNEKLQY